MSKDMSFIRSAKLWYTESPHVIKWSLRRETDLLTDSLSKEFLLDNYTLPPLPFPHHPISHSIPPVLPFQLHSSLSFPKVPSSPSLKPTIVHVSNWCRSSTELEPRAKDLNLPPTVASHLHYLSAFCPQIGIFPPTLHTHSSAVLWWHWLLCSIFFS